MSTTSSTRRVTTATNKTTTTTGSRINTTTTRPTHQDTSRLVSTLYRPTASSTSKANTPLLQPKRPLQPAHIRHQKSNSLSSISSDKLKNYSYTGASPYLDLETKKNSNTISGTTKPSKPPSHLTSRIPVRTGTTSSMTPSKHPPSNGTTKPTVLQPKTNLAAVSSVNGNNSIKNTRLTQVKPSNGVGSSSALTKPPTLALKPNGSISSRQKPPLPLNKTNHNTTLTPLKKQGSLSQLNGTNRAPLPGTKPGPKPVTDDSIKKKGHRNSFSASYGTTTSLALGGTNSRKVAPRTSGSSTLTKPSPTNPSRIRVSNGAIQPPSKTSAVNGVVNNTVASLKPSLPLKAATGGSSSGLYAKSSSSISSEVNGATASKIPTVDSKNLSTSPKSYAKGPASTALSKSLSASRTTKLSEASGRPSLKSTSDSKIRLPKSSNLASTRSPAYHDSPVGLSKKTSLNHNFNPRAASKELGSGTSPSNPQLNNFKRGTSMMGSQSYRKSNLHSPIPQYIDRASSSVSMTSNYFCEPLLPEEVLKTFGTKLSSFEHKEILDYPRVYYFGANAKKFQSRDRHTKPFSTQEGDLLFEVSDHLAYRYEIQKILGKGSFGQVVRAYDYKVGRDVAIKIIRNSERFHRQALTEIQLLEALTRWDKDGDYNVLHILDNFFFRGHLCIVTELYGINLYEYIKQNQFAGFRLSAVRNFATQILKCLSLLSSHNVIHCDLKPENILLAGPSNSSIKVIDFGSSCFTSQRIYTYIQSRFYRSPEVILELPYGPPIDMWSFGCILAELSNGHPIFPGETEAEQMACILEVLGFPDPALLAKSRRRYSFFDVAGNPRPSLSPRRRRLVGSKPLAKALKSSDEQFVDFVSRCLEFSPDKRITPDEALHHPWIAGSKPIPRGVIPTTSLYPKPRVIAPDASEPAHVHRSGISSRSGAFSDLETDNGTLHGSNSSDS